MIAIIPARAGSKGLLGKNIKLFLGKPLIFHTIKEALKSKNINEVFISTDSDEIAQIAISYGARCPFLRPFQLATDDAKAIDNYIYTIGKLNNELHYNIEEFMVLQPTSPLRTVADIDKALKIYIEKDADSVISITEMIHPPHWAKKIAQDGKISSYFNELSDDNANRQSHTKAYIPNGAIFIFKVDLLRNAYSYYSEKTYGYIMSPQCSVDIDTQFDFELAEFLMGKRNERPE